MPGPSCAETTLELLPVSAAAELLSVEPETVARWIRDDRIPYVERVVAPQPQIPLHGLLATLRADPSLRQQLLREQATAGVSPRPRPVLRPRARHAFARIGALAWTQSA